MTVVTDSPEVDVASTVGDGGGGAGGRPVVLRGDRVQKRYVSQDGSETQALTASTFDVHQGEFISLVGPSGCGKTTLLKICAGLVAPTEGGVTYRGTGRPVQPGTYGMVFQSPALLPWRTVRQNILLPQQVLRSEKRAAEARVEELLDLVQLPASAKSYPGELSGGMQQRVAIARSLVHDPELLFMDEPFGALDAMTREELNDSVQDIQLRSGKTVMFVTHDIAEAVFLGDRVFVMSAHPGRIIEEIAVDVPRPRTIESRTSEAFRAAEARIRELLYGRNDGSKR